MTLTPAQEAALPAALMAMLTEFDAPDADRASPFPNPSTGAFPMDEQDISYALAKQVPDMASRGFIIGTSYGDLNIPPGPMAERIARAVTTSLQVELIAVARHSPLVA